MAGTNMIGSAGDVRISEDQEYDRVVNEGVDAYMHQDFDYEICQARNSVAIQRSLVGSVSRSVYSRYPEEESPRPVSPTDCSLPSPPFATAGHNIAASFNSSRNDSIAPSQTKSVARAGLENGSVAGKQIGDAVIGARPANSSYVRVSTNDGPGRRLSNYRVFGQTRRQGNGDAAAWTGEEREQKLRKRRGMADLRTSFTEMFGGGAQPTEEMGEPAATSKRRRFDRVRSSVEDFSASLKQLAGRKRDSAEEHEEPPVKAVRMQSTASPACKVPSRRATQFFADAPTLDALEGRSEQVPDAQDPALQYLRDAIERHGRSEIEVVHPALRRAPSPALEPHWAGDEEFTFRAYVLAAEDSSWDMDLS